MTRTRWVDRVFSKEECNTGHQIEIDMQRVLFILTVAFVHCAIECTTDEGLETGLPYILDTVLGGPMLAPVLMFTMGICLNYAGKRTWQNFVRRGIRLFFIGFVLNLLRYTLLDLLGYAITGDYEKFIAPLVYYTFENDILQFAGLALASIGLMIRLGIPDAAKLAIALGFSILGTFLNGIDLGSVGWNIALGYFIGTEDAAGEVRSYFVYLNWFLLPVAGYVAGKYLRRVKDKELLYRTITPFTLLFSLSYFGIGIANGYGMFGDGQACYYHVVTRDALACIVSSTAMLGTYYLICVRLSAAARRVIFTFSANLTTVYVIHWILVSAIVRVGIYAVRGTQLLPLPWMLAVSTLILVLSVMLAFRFGKLINRYF